MMNNENNDNEMLLDKENQNTNNKTENVESTNRTFFSDMPVVALRNIVMLPKEMLNFDVGNTRNMNALQTANTTDGFVFITCLKNGNDDVKQLSDMYAFGVVCKIKQIMQMPGNTLRVLVEGVFRASAIEISKLNEKLVCVNAGRYVENRMYDRSKTEAYRNKIDEKFSEFAKFTKRLTPDAVKLVRKIENDLDFIDAVANQVITKAENRQKVLEAINPDKRIEIIYEMISHEVEMLKLDNEIEAKTRAAIEKGQKEYYLREKIKVIRQELGEGEEALADKYRQRMKEKQLPDFVREKLENEITKLENYPSGSHEAPMCENYIECVLSLPWTEKSVDTIDIELARKILDDDHYGLEKVKERIIEYLAVAKLTGKLSGQIICLVGPPGVGKTSVSRSIARAVGREFVRMSLGGVHDEAELRGHRRTYIGAKYGRIIDAMMKAKTVNPLILFDEIDKLSSDHRGDPASAMLEILDGEQNFEFRDNFLELPYDLSNVMFITTANSKSTIPAPLLDRMEIIDVPSYLETEKVEIAKRYLVKKQMNKCGLENGQLLISDEMLSEIIDGYTREAGVRTLERMIGSVCRKAACEIAEGKKYVRVTENKLEAYLGNKRFKEDDKRKDDEVGIVTGLAWTAVGGTTLDVEVQITKGKGDIKLTGQLGDVMKESATAALTYVKAHCDELGIDADRFSKSDIHIHVPEGATPKDGPSAGVTMTTAIVSALTGIPVKASVAMTGEVTLRGRVLPIGGLREKMLAALKAGVKTVIVPERNRADVGEVPKEIREKLKVLYADNVSFVIENALVKKPLNSESANEYRVDDIKNKDRDNEKFLHIENDSKPISY